MKRYKLATIVFSVIAILLSDIMCAIVAYNYCDMLYGIEYKGYSAPASIAYVCAIPYSIGIIVCVLLAIFSFRNMKKNKYYKH